MEAGASTSTREVGTPSAVATSEVLLGASIIKINNSNKHFTNQLTAVTTTLISVAEGQLQPNKTVEIKCCIFMLLLFTGIFTMLNMIMLC